MDKDKYDKIYQFLLKEGFGVDEIDCFTLFRTKKLISKAYREELVEYLHQFKTEVTHDSDVAIQMYGG